MPNIYSESQHQPHNRKVLHNMLLVVYFDKVSVT
jgi:hypothetical protein